LGGGTNVAGKKKGPVASRGKIFRKKERKKSNRGGKKEEGAIASINLERKKNRPSLDIPSSNSFLISRKGKALALKRTRLRKEGRNLLGPGG